MLKHGFSLSMGYLESSARACFHLRREKSSKERKREREREREREKRKKDGKSGTRRRTKALLRNTTSNFRGGHAVFYRQQHVLTLCTNILLLSNFYRDIIYVNIKHCATIRPEKMLLSLWLWFDGSCFPAASRIFGSTSTCNFEDGAFTRYRNSQPLSNTVL